ncbi:hypothetical protein GF373_14130, partial [bacterium]|nr:hypothetical protein [bacterium]
HQTADIMSAEYFSRWAAKFVDFEQRKDKLGFLYEVDARLRPYGSGSMLASSQQAFLDYFNRQAQFWEKMALSRARFVCGNPAIDRALDELKQSLLFSHPIREEEIQQLLSMRQKIEASKKKETLKAGPGGIVDVEFIAQALVLYYGWEYPSMRTTSTLATLREARTLELIPIDQADELETSYIFLREVENRLRIVNNVSMDHIPDDPVELEKLTKRYALRMDQEQPSSERFLLTISTHTKKVRSIYHTFFAELLEKANPSHE